MARNKLKEQLLPSIFLFFSVKIAIEINTLIPVERKDRSNYKRKVNLESFPQYLARCMSKSKHYQIDKTITGSNHKLSDQYVLESA